jgi:hypothetical protein
MGAQGFGYQRWIAASAARNDGGVVIASDSAAIYLFALLLAICWLAGRRLPRLRLAMTMRGGDDVFLGA